MEKMQAKAKKSIAWMTNQIGRKINHFKTWKIVNSTSKRSFHFIVYHMEWTVDIITNCNNGCYLFSHCSLYNEKKNSGLR